MIKLNLKKQKQPKLLVRYHMKTVYKTIITQKLCELRKNTKKPSPDSNVACNFFIVLIRITSFKN